jgi:hypothetical protein
MYRGVSAEHGLRRLTQQQPGCRACDIPLLGNSRKNHEKV